MNTNDKIEKLAKAGVLACESIEQANENIAKFNELCYKYINNEKLYELIDAHIKTCKGNYHRLNNIYQIVVSEMINNEWNKKANTLINKIQKYNYCAKVIENNNAYIEIYMQNLKSIKNFQYCNDYVNVFFNFDKNKFEVGKKDYMDKQEITDNTDMITEGFKLPVFEIWEQDNKVIVNLEEV